MEELRRPSEGERKDIGIGQHYTLRQALDGSRPRPRGPPLAIGNGIRHFAGPSPRGRSGEGGWGRGREGGREGGLRGVQSCVPICITSARLYLSYLCDSFVQHPLPRRMSVRCECRDVYLRCICRSSAVACSSASISLLHFPDRFLFLLRSRLQDSLARGTCASSFRYSPPSPVGHSLDPLHLLLSVTPLLRLRPGPLCVTICAVILCRPSVCPSSFSFSTLHTVSSSPRPLCCLPFRLVRIPLGPFLNLGLNPRVYLISESNSNPMNSDGLKG